MSDAFVNDIMKIGETPLLGDLLTLGDVLFAAVAALPLMWLARFLWRLVRNGFRRSIRLSAGPEELAMLLESCRKMFPIERVPFRGQMFQRGMTVRITLAQDESFEGELIGMNEDNVVCVVSDEVVAADRLDNLVNMAAVAEGDAPEKEDIQE